MKNQKMEEAVELFAEVMILGRNRITNEIPDNLLNQISPEQVELLDFLMKYGAMTSTEIQNRMLVGKSALSNRLKKMENNGYVKFVPSSEDQRVKYVEITDEGKKSHERHTRLVNEYVSELLQDINEEEVEQFIQTFHKIRSILQKGGQQK